MRKKQIQIFTEEEKPINEVILNKGVLGYLDKGILINPTFKDGLFGNELYSYWYDFKENKIKLGKFLKLNEIKIMEKGF